MQSTNKMFSIVLGVLFIESLVLALFYDNFASAILIGLPALLVPLYFFQSTPEATINKHVTAIALMVFSALHIHQTFGLIEVHFEIFILMALLIVYQDWRVFVTAIIVVAVAIAAPISEYLVIKK